MYEQVNHDMQISILSMPYDEKDTQTGLQSSGKEIPVVTEHNTAPNRVKEQG
jgi:hypothetical protein